VAEGPVELAVRPHAIQLAAADEASGGVPGRILYAAYLGDHMEYEVAVTLGGREITLFACTLDVDTPRAIGDAVSVGFAPQSVTVIPA
jgi:iron(III) transport system ATP-binding protein